MMAMPRSRIRALLALALLLTGAAPLLAQGVEIAPFIGFRGGSGFYEAAPRLRSGHDSQALGVIVDVPLSGGLKFEAAFSHQKSGPLSTDHWQAGGLQEYLSGGARPFVTGILGLTRYATGADSEIRFTAGAGGGVTLGGSAPVGVRLDGRVFATFLDAQGTALACGGNGRCFVALHVNVAWQAEFTAALVLRVR
jgi:hypothetical protein